MFFEKISLQRVAVTKIFPEYLPGVLIAFLIAASAQYISHSMGGPVMLYALLFGISLGFLSEDEKCQPGVLFASRNLLRVGVALLGVQITWMEVASLGWSTILLAVSAVTFTILIGVLIARLLKLDMTYSFLSAGAVAICGASAALALSSVLPDDKEGPPKDHTSLENNTLLVVVGVTALSTIAMVIYPVVIETLNLDHRTAGIFLGASIHDVAQVIGAGYMISPETGDIAAIVKLLRVACLVPAVMIVGFVFRRQKRAEMGLIPNTPLLPLFLVGFVAFVAINSFGLIPEKVTGFLSAVSRWFLITAIAALGMKTSFKKFFALGYRPVLALVAQTVFLAVFILVTLA